MSVTFKLYSQRGPCRRITFPSAPEFSVISDVARDMANAESPELFYRDSEGDWIIVASSGDVVEAVRDARQAGAPTVRIHVRASRKSRATEEAESTPQRWQRFHDHVAAPRCAWGGRSGWATLFPRYRPARPCYRTGVFTTTGDVFGDVGEVVDALCRAFSPAAEVTAQGAKNGPTAGSKSEGDDAAVAEQTTTAEAGRRLEDEKASGTPASTEVVTSTASATVSDAPAITNAGIHSVDDHATATDEGTSEEPVKVLEEASFVKVEAPQTVREELAAEEKTSDDGAGAEAKVALLRDMGFELPHDVATNMIKEMGGRMDLIVRALVANK